MDTKGDICHIITSMPIYMQLMHAQHLLGIMHGSRGGTGGPDPPPEKLQKYRVS